MTEQELLNKKIFKVDFNIYHHRDILPKLDDYLAHDFIINEDHYQKGDIDSCIWKRYIPEPGEAESQEYRKREITRILKTGAWFRNHEMPIWIPPPYYFALQYGRTGDDDLQFRLKRLKHVYFKIRARNNPQCKGTFTVKNRQDGETTMAVTDGLWECADGGMMNNGMIGIQSKTREDAQTPCWFTVQTLWQGLEQWVKDELFSDFSSGDNIAEKLRFQRNRSETQHARNILYKYFPAVYNAMDGKNNVKRCILDEVLKWLECIFGDTLDNYSKFIMPGLERRGLFDIFSSPPEHDCKSYRDGYDLWINSDPNDLDPTTGTTKSRIHRYASNPLEGIQGAYDKYGDADPSMIYDHIMRERKSKSKDKILNEIRGFPMDEEEMWGTLEAGTVWSNTEGLKERKVYLIGARFKDKETKEPKVLYGNLERIDGYIDGDVEFRQADLDHFDLQKARFCFSYLPQNKEPLESIFRPPAYVENCLGLDPFNHRYPAKNKGKQSDAGMVNRKFRDIHETGINKCPTMIYCCRPQHQDIMFEDALKAAIFNRALLQYENANDKFANYAEDRGYSEWLLPSIGAPRDSRRKGDAPTGKGKFLEEGIGLIDAATNVPLRVGDPYWLELYWHLELINDYLRFDPTNTQKSNLTMADMQALIGAIKIMHKKIRHPSDLNHAVMEYLLT